MNPPSFDLEMSQLWRWGRKAALAIADQGIFSGSNFLLNILLVRWLSIEGFGQFAIAYAAMLLILHVYIAALLEPMSVLGPSDHSEHMAGYFLGQLKLHFMLTAILGGILVIGTLVWGKFTGTGAASPLFTVGLGLPFLLAPYFFRRVFYILERPAVALFGSTLYAIVLIALLFAARHIERLTPQLGFSLMAVAGLVCLVSIFAWLDLKDGVAVEWPQLVAANWQFGKWLIASAMLIAVSSQASIFLAGSLLGLSEAGVIRALQTIIQPMLLSIAALSALVTPMVSRDFSTGKMIRFRRRIFFQSLALAGGALLFEVILLVFHRQIDILFYNGKLAAYSSLIPVWGIIPVILALTSGLQVAFQAAQRTQAMLYGALLWVGVSFGLGIIMTHRAGIWGTSVSAVIGYSILGIVLWLIFRRWLLPLISKGSRVS